MTRPLARSEKTRAASTDARAVAAFAVGRRRAIRLRAGSCRRLGSRSFKRRASARRTRLSLLLRPLVGRLLINTVGLIVAASATTRSSSAPRLHGLSNGRICRVGRSGPFSPWPPWLIPPFISSFAWVSLSNGLQDFAGALGGDHLRLLSARLSAGGRGASRTGSRVGRDRAFAGANLLGMLLSGRPAAASSRPLRRRIARRPRHADGIRRVFAAALSHLHDRALRPIPNRTGRARVVLVGSGPRRALRCLSDRRIESARRQTLRARRRGNAAQLSVGAAGLDPMAGAGRVRCADPRDAGNAVGHGRLLAVATCLGGDIARRAFAAASVSTRRWLPSAMVWPEPPRPFCWRRRWAILQRAIPARWTVLLERIAYLAQGVPGIVVALALISLTVELAPPAVSERDAAWCSPTPFCSCRSLWSACARPWLRSRAGSRKPLAPSGSVGSRSPAVCSRRSPDRVSGPGQRLVFVFVATELTPTLLLAPIGTRTLATEVWANTCTSGFRGCGALRGGNALALASGHLAARQSLWARLLSKDGTRRWPTCASPH